MTRDAIRWRVSDKLHAGSGYVATWRGLTLEISDGMLGVTLTVRGEGIHAGSFYASVDQAKRGARAAALRCLPTVEAQEGGATRPQKKGPRR